IHRCRFGNESCLVESLNGYIKTFAKGIPEKCFRPFNRLSGPNFPLFNDSTDLPIGLRLNLKNLTLNGLENSTVLSVKGFEQDPTQKKILIEIRIPRLECVAKFDFDTKLLLFRASGNGSFNVDAQNFHLNISFKVFVEFRQGKRYLRVYDMDFNVDLDRCIVSLDNLYEWNTDLSIALNRVMNEHWLEFWNELESRFLPYFSRMGVDRLSRFFYYFSYDEMFIS
ncbi:hypothetical protein KR067_012282, partial [Drosophila pandora]